MDSATAAVVAQISVILLFGGLFTYLVGSALHNAIERTSEIMMAIGISAWIFGVVAIIVSRL